MGKRIIIIRSSYVIIRLFTIVEGSGVSGQGGGEAVGGQ